MTSTIPINIATGCTAQETRAMEALALGMSRDQAWKHAGYSNRQALIRALQRPRCQAYLEKLQEDAKEKFILTRDDVIRGLKSAIDDAQILSDPSAQISGWREIGKMLGYYAPEEKKIVLTTNQQELKDKLEGLTDEELLKLSGEDSLTVIDGEWEEVDENGN